MDDFPEGTLDVYQSVSPCDIVPTNMGDMTAGICRLPAGLTVYPAVLLSVPCAETPDMSTMAQTRIARLVTDTFIVTVERVLESGS